MPSKQGKVSSLGAMFLFMFFLPCVWGLGFQKDSPLASNTPHIGTGPSEMSRSEMAQIGRTNVWKFHWGEGRPHLAHVGVVSPCGSD